MSANRQDDRQDQRSSTARLHPRVWAGLIGFVIWFVLAIWGFGTEGYADWLLTVVSGFILIAVAIPLILAREHVQMVRCCEKFHRYPSPRYW